MSFKSLYSKAYKGSICYDFNTFESSLLHKHPLETMSADDEKKMLEDAKKKKQ